jgi:two-component system sensor histidine kinase HydH
LPPPSVGLGSASAERASPRPKSWKIEAPPPSRSEERRHTVIAYEMRGEIWTYRIPVAVTTLMVLGVGFWGWTSWRGILEHDRDKARRFAAGVFDSMEGTVKALGQDGRLGRGQIAEVLENVIRNSPVRFVVLEKDGVPILSSGKTPGSLALPSEEGEGFSGEHFLLWRKVNLQGDPRAGQEHEGAGAEQTAVSVFPPGEVLMVVGLEPPPNRPGASRAERGLLLTLVTALLFIAASLMAWIMVIRGRLLAQELEAERARRTHLEELSLAAAGLAHETKNPLGIIMGVAQQIANNPHQPEETRVMLEHIVDEVDRTAAKLGDFINFARQREVKATVLDAQKLCSKVVDILRPDFKAAGVELELELVPAMIVADEEMLRQILVNLLLNALHASSQGGKVTIRMQRRGDRVSLSVEDQGRGIGPDLLPNIFKPYVAGTPEGHGLGLAIVKRYVEDHGWSIEVRSEPSCGTMMTISGIRVARQEGSRP